MREGISVYIQLIDFVEQQKLTQHCKTIILQFKKHNATKQNNDNITAWRWHEDRRIDQWYKIEIAEINPHIRRQLSFGQVSKTIL